MDLDEFEIYAEYQRIKSSQKKIYACADTHNKQCYSALAWAW